MPVMEPSAAAEQAQPLTQTLPAGGEQPPRQDPADFTAFIDGMNDATEMESALFGTSAPTSTPADVSLTPGDTPQEDPDAVADEPAGAQPQDAATETDSPAEPQHAPNLERISLKSLHPDDRLLVAQAKDLVREGKAPRLADAIYMLTQPSAGTPEPSPYAQAPATTEAQPQAQAPAPLPVAPEQDPEVAHLASHLATLRNERKTAVEEFDRPKELELTSEIEDTLSALAEAKSQAAYASREGQIQEHALTAAVQDIYVQFPESEDATSYFSYRLTQEVQSYEEAYGSIRQRPEQLRVLADKVQTEIHGSVPAAPAAQAQPAAAPAPRQVARPLGVSAPGNASAARPSSDQVQRILETADEATLQAVLFGPR